MDKKEGFGVIAASTFEVGDIVEWTKWNSTSQKWDSIYGILIEIENKIVSNRFVSVSTIKPLSSKQSVIELFTMNLKPVDIKQKNDMIT